MSETAGPIDPETLLAHGDFVRGIARSLLWDEHAADDVVQQTWIAALGARDEPSRGWLGAVARNLAIKRLRGDRRRVARESAAARPEGVPSDEDVLEREHLRRSVVDAVLALDEPYRATVLLRFFEGLPPRDVARRMDVPVETVRTRTRRAVDLLRSRLDARHGADRGRFCAALSVWAGARGGGASPVAGGGALLMGAKSIAACAGITAVGIAAWLFWPSGTPLPDVAAAPVPPPAARPSPPPAPRAAPQEVRPEPAPAPVPELPKPVVKGRVVDTQGRAAAGFELFVMGEGAATTDASGKRTGNMRRLQTDADGRFETELASAAACTVMPMASPAFEPKKGDKREVTPPAENVDFVVERKPTATFVVTALDLDENKPLAQFTCAFASKAGRPQPSASTDGKVEALVRLAASEGDTITVTLSANGATAQRDVAVRADERVEVRMEISRGAAVRGRVLDANGAPLTGALVWFGEEDVARGDEPFKPFDEKRLRDAVRTDADGRFEIRGTGRWISFWHAQASPVTVGATQASKVTLPARGTIRGVLRGADGAPTAATKVYLDRMQETTTDAAGAFVFEGVEAGTRGLSLEPRKPKAYFAVRVAGGETVTVEMRPGLPKVRIEWPGRTEFGRAAGLVPTGVSGSMAIAQTEGGALVAENVTPGRYLVLAEGGAVTTVDVASDRATATVGRGEIVVHAKAKSRIYVVPEGSSYLARLLAGRQAGAGVPADGVQRFTGLAPGRYEVGVERDGVRAAVEVRDAAVDVTVE